MSDATIVSQGFDEPIHILSERMNIIIFKTLAAVYIWNHSIDIIQMNLNDSLPVYILS